MTDTTEPELSTHAFGVAVGPGRQPARVVVSAGDRDSVLEVGALARADGWPEAAALEAAELNPFLALGRTAWDSVFTRLATADPEPFLTPRDQVELPLPFEVADYVDFYSSENHAANVGQIFRPGTALLTPNWKHLPIGYHGRAGTVVVSGTPVTRPNGIRLVGESPEFGPCLKLDIEAEVGFVVGTPAAAPVSVGEFPEHVFGVVLLNDWSARDIQAYEYVPLGPFLGKSFATSVSAWVTPLASVEAARVAPPPRDPEPAEYLRDEEDWGLDLALEIEWNGTVVSRPPFASTYWTAAQQLAHMTVNGATLRTGDLFGSGTVSGPQRHQRGSFLELSWNGRDQITLDNGQQRTFLEDDDVVTLRATAPAVGGGLVVLGEVCGRIRAGQPASGSRSPRRSSAMSPVNPSRIARRPQNTR